MPSFAPSRPAGITPLGRRAPHRLAQELLGRIKAGLYRRGDWLPTEHELLIEFPVSRTTLREALIILECLGLIVTHRGAGSQVVGGPPRTRTDAATFDLLAMLEACRAFEIEVASLAASLEEEDGAPSALQSLVFSASVTVETCRRFHISLAQSTGNGAISAAIEDLWNSTQAKADMRAPFEQALTRAGRAVCALQARVVVALARRSASETREAVGALFETYIAAVIDDEDRERLARIERDSAEVRQRWRRRSIAADRASAGWTKR